MLKIGDSILLPRNVLVKRYGETLRFEEGSTVYVSGHGSVITETGEEIYLKIRYLTRGINYDGVLNYIDKKISELKEEERTPEKEKEITDLYLKAFGLS